MNYFIVLKNNNHFLVFISEYTPSMYLPDTSSLLDSNWISCNDKLMLQSRTRCPLNNVIYNLHQFRSHYKVLKIKRNELLLIKKLCNISGLISFIDTKNRDLCRKFRHNNFIYNYMKYFLLKVRYQLNFFS